MAYINENGLSFAQGYYRIDGRGVVSFAKGMPEDIIVKFWEVWPSFREKVVSLEKQGVITGKYPVLPFENPEENKIHYVYAFL